MAGKCVGEVIASNWEGKRVCNISIRLIEAARKSCDCKRSVSPGVLFTVVDFLHVRKDVLAVSGSAAAISHGWFAVRRGIE